MVKKILAAAIHIALVTVIQAHFAACFVFFYDYTITYLLLLVLACAAAIGVDYLMHYWLLRGSNLNTFLRIIQIINLLLVVPLIAVNMYVFVWDIIEYGEVFSAGLYQIVWTVALLLVDACLLFERKKLRKKLTKG